MVKRERELTETVRFESLSRSHVPSESINKFYLGGIPSDHGQSVRGSFFNYNIGETKGKGLSHTN